MAVSTVSLLLLVSVAAAVNGDEEALESVERNGNGGIQPYDSLWLADEDFGPKEENGNGGIQPYGDMQLADLLKGKKKCRTKVSCGNIGGECTKKKACDGEVVKVNKGCSKGCVCCKPYPLYTTTPFPIDTTTPFPIDTTPSTGSEWSIERLGCLWGHNDKKITVENLEGCKEACEGETSFVCVSLDYRPRNGVCWLSKTNSSSEDYMEPCGSGYEDLLFAEIISDEDHDKDDHYICENGRHVPGWLKCDGYDDCGDGSDEKTCSSCQQGETKCPTGECIRNAWKCDGFEDCSDASDEKDCGLKPLTGGSQTVAPHSCTGFQCKNNRCIVSSWKCDGYDDCGDNSDEKNCNKCSSSQFTCASDGKCIAGNWKCDKYKDCSDGSDEADCKKETCKSSQFQCLSSGKCIYGSWKCDNYKDCDDGSDEKDCQKCTSAQFECKNKKCVSSSSKCNGKDDCGDKSDEENCPTTCQCGVPNTSRIVNGAEVNPKRKYPWQIGLVSPGYYISCGGSIINDRWILTAAHCVVDKNTCRVKYDSSSTIRVALGEHHQFETSDDDSNTKKYTVKTFVKHPNYNCKTLDYDFALLELTEAIPFNNVIRPICLPKDDSKTYAGQTGTVSGWGLSGTGGSMSNFLKEVQIPILANDKCGSWRTPAAMKVCAGQSGKNSCGGDSGGPLSVVENNKYVQIGVVSYGHKSGCASAAYPSVYARVSTVVSWISTTTASGKKCD